MRIIHDTRACTPSGHSAYRGYDATRGKLPSLSPTGRVYTCPICQSRFTTSELRHQHIARQHSGDGDAA